MSSTLTFESIVKGKQYELEEKIDIEHGLLSKLVDNGVITRRHRTAIEVTIVTSGIFLAEHCRPIFAQIKHMTVMNMSGIQN